MLVPKKSTVGTPQKSRLRKGIFIVLAFLAAFVALITVLAFIFAEIQQPKFVNRDLVMQNKLIIPPILKPQIVGKEKVFVLSAEQGETIFLEGKPTKTEGYNGNYLGPTLRAHKGDHVRIVLTNNLSQPITTHWQGMHLPAIMDGGPHQEIAPGEAWEPQLSWILGNVLFGVSVIRSRVFQSGQVYCLLIIGSLVIPVAYLIG